MALLIYVVIALLRYIVIAEIIYVVEVLRIYAVLKLLIYVVVALLIYVLFCTIFHYHGRCPFFLPQSLSNLAETPTLSPHDGKAVSQSRLPSHEIPEACHPEAHFLHKLNDAPCFSSITRHCSGTQPGAIQSLQQMHCLGKVDRCFLQH